MKKLLFFSLIFVSIGLYAQDSVKVTELPVAVSPDQDDVLYFIQDGVSTQIAKSTLFKETSDSIYNNSVGIATNVTNIANNANSISSLNIAVVANGDDIDDLYDTTALHLDTLRDHNNRLISLESGSVSYTAGNGLDLTGTEFSLGNTLTADVGFDGAFDFKIGNYTDQVAELFLMSTDASVLWSEGYTDILYAPNLLTGADAKYIRLNDASMTVYDNDDHVGLVYNADYSSNYTDRSIVDKEYVDSQVSSDSSWTSITVDTLFGNVNGSDDFISFNSTFDGILIMSSDGAGEQSYITALSQGNSSQIGWSSSITEEQVSASFSGSGVNMQYDSTGAGTRSIRISYDQFKINDTYGEEGLKYNADYSANFTDRSLIDKEYVDTKEEIMHVSKTFIYFTTTSQTTIITLPSNSIIWDIQVDVDTEFDGSGTDLVDIGITGDGNRYEDNLDVSSAVWPSMSLTDVPERMSGATNITAQYFDSGGDSTQGRCAIYVHYSLH